MADYKEVLRLSSDFKNTKRRIARMLHCSYHTVTDIRNAAKEAGVTLPLDEGVTNKGLRSILFPMRFATETMYAAPDYAYIPTGSWRSLA